MSKVTLQPAGQGLPFIEAFISRHIIFPYVIRKMTQNQATHTVIAIGQQAIELQNKLPIDDMAKPTLIPRVRGIEDSSRNWSIIMTIEHLLITSRAMQDIATQLSNEQCPTQIVRIEDVKPQPAQSPTNILKDYKKHLDQYSDEVAKLTNLKNPNFTHAHPWFGELTAHDWLALNAAHHDIHWRQIKEIIKRV